VALTALATALAQVYAAQRAAQWQEGPGWYTALVSDLVVDDFLWGPRARVAATGATVSGLRTLTLERLGVQWTVSWAAAQAEVISR
jgi:hypothetical protein